MPPTVIGFILVAPPLQDDGADDHFSRGAGDGDVVMADGTARPRTALDNAWDEAFEPGGIAMSSDDDVNAENGNGGNGTTDDEDQEEREEDEMEEYANEEDFAHNIQLTVSPCFLLALADSHSLFNPQAPKFQADGAQDQAFSSDEDDEQPPPPRHRRRHQLSAAAAQPPRGFERPSVAGNGPSPTGHAAQQGKASEWTRVSANQAAHRDQQQGDLQDRQREQRRRQRQKEQREQHQRRVLAAAEEKRRQQRDRDQQQMQRIRRDLNQDRDVPRPPVR